MRALSRSMHATTERHQTKGDQPMRCSDPATQRADQGLPVRWPALDSTTKCDVGDAFDRGQQPESQYGHADVIAEHDEGRGVTSSESAVMVRQGRERVSPEGTHCEPQSSPVVQGRLSGTSMKGRVCFGHRAGSRTGRASGARVKTQRGGKRRSENLNPTLPPFRLQVTYLTLHLRAMGFQIPAFSTDQEFHRA